MKVWKWTTSMTEIKPTNLKIVQHKIWVGVLAIDQPLNFYLKFIETINSGLMLKIIIRTPSTTMKKLKY